jgi:hypothetical protein
MELAIIIVVLAIIGLFVWRSYTASKHQNPDKSQRTGNPNPNAPTSSKRL